VAEDRLSDQAIADTLGVTKRTLENWKKVPEFHALVSEHRAAIHAAIMEHGIGDVMARTARRQRTMEGLLQIVQERAKDPEMQQVPGGLTGLIVGNTRFVKVIEAAFEKAAPASSADEAADPEEDLEARVVYRPTKQVEPVREYAIDTGLLAELRALEAQTAKELGQVAERHEHTGKGGGPIRVMSGPDLSQLPDEDLEELERILSNAGGGAGGEGAA